MSLSWVNDRVGGPCQPGARTRTLSTLQFTPSGQGGRVERRKDEVDDRRNEAVNQVSAKTKGGQRKMLPDTSDNQNRSFINDIHFSSS